MLARPLDVASRLQPPPHFFDALFYVNVALIGLFFAVFGSRFVVAPGLEIQLPVMAGSSGLPSTHSLTVAADGRIYTTDSLILFDKLGVWLGVQAEHWRRTTPGNDRPSLLVKMHGDAKLGTITRIQELARENGFDVQIAVTIEAP